MANRAPDFRHLFANTIGFAWSDNECRLTFGLEDGGGPDNAYEQVAINMTHRTAKILALHLGTVIEIYERNTGVEIPFDADKLVKIREVMDANPAPNGS